MSDSFGPAAVGCDLGGVLSFEPWPANADTRPAAGPGTPRHNYLVGVESEALSQVLEAVMPMLGQLLAEKASVTRAHKLEELVDFLTGRIVGPSPVDLKMAQRLAARHARLLTEFGYASAEELAEMNHSRAANRGALADNWKKRRQVFAVRHQDESGRAREVYPLFQFQDGRPIKAMQPVIEAFGEHKAPWKLALWFTSSNGWLPGQARPVDLLESDPDAVIRAAQRDAGGSAA